jgi:hypothetical protein
MENNAETPEQTQPNSSNDPIYSRFRKEREEWSEKVTDMSDRLKDIHHLSDLMTEIYSSRQIAVEYSHTLMSHLSKVNRIYRERRVERYDHYTRNYDIRLDKDPKNDLINTDLGDIVERRELLQNHLDYFRETVRTIDTLCFGIKHRMALEEYRRG